MRTIAFIACVIVLFADVKITSATHARGGQITFEQVPNSYDVKVTLSTLTNTEATAADRPVTEISWGDGTSSGLQRVAKIDIGHKTWRNTYESMHTYPGPGLYRISIFDSNRGKVDNIDNAYAVPFYIESVIMIEEGRNDKTPDVRVLDVPVACVGNTFIYGLNAIDADGDSIVFSLITPLKSQQDTISGYSIPEASEYFTISSITGELRWEKPVKQGQYTVVIRIDEYRNGELIGYVIRDFQIVVEACNTSSIIPEGNEFKMYFISNPAIDKVSIRFSKPVSDASLFIYDMGGKLVTRRAGINGDQVSFRTESLSKGVYLVRLQGDKVSSTGKFIVE